MVPDRPSSASDPPIVDRALRARSAEGERAAMSTAPVTGHAESVPHDDRPESAVEPIRGPLPEAISLLVQSMGVALAVIEPSGQLAFANQAARLFARSLEPAREEADHALLQHWLPSLVPPHAMDMCRQFGSWSGEVGLSTTTRLDRRAFIQLIALGTSQASACGLVIRDVTKEHQRETELFQRNGDLEIAYARLRDAQDQAIRAEKLASIGQLAAGVAHEINNPIAYVKSNLNALRRHLPRLLAMTGNHGHHVADDGEEDPAALAADIQDMILESLEGVERVSKIVSDLKDFSRQDQLDNWVTADINAGLQSTLNIVWNELKYKANVVRDLGEIPPVECLPSQLNQVFMNLLVNAAQAIEQQGIITVTTDHVDGEVRISIGDDGQGIPEDVLPRIFDPFFTTKGTGEGTGLGLAISYGIIAKHHGTIEVTSSPGDGTLFLIKIPVRQPQTADDSRRAA